MSKPQTHASPQAWTPPWAAVGTPSPLPVRSHRPHAYVFQLFAVDARLDGTYEYI